MLDTGHPVYIRIVGDAATAAPYIGLAKKKVRELANKRKDQRNQITEWGQLDKDITYKATITGDHWSVLILTNTCGIGDSGVYSDWYPWEFMPESVVESWVSKYQVDNYGNYKVDAGGNKLISTTGLSEFRNQKKPLPHNATYMGSGFTGDTIKQGLKDFEDEERLFYSQYKASKYSGAMRKVVQVLLGLGKMTLGKMSDMFPINPATGKPEFVFHYKFNKAHGIYISSTTGEWWVIQIGKDGIFRRKANWCINRSYKTVRDDVRIFSGFAGSEWVKIGDLDTFYKKYGPFYSACGWAFDPVGHNAQNVGFTVVYSGGYPYIESHRWKVTITEDANGVPTAATSAEIEKGIVWNTHKIDIDYMAHFQVPSETSLGSETFDFNMGHYAAPPAGSSGPLHVYYGDTGIEVVAYFKREANRDAADDNESNPIYQARGYSAPFATVYEGWYHGTSMDDLQPIDSKFVSKDYTNSGTASNIAECTQWTPPAETYAHGGATSEKYEYVGPAPVDGRPGNTQVGAYVYVSGSRRWLNQGVPPATPNYCNLVSTSEWRETMMFFVTPELLLNRQITTTPQRKNTDCAVVVPYGERQSVILTSQINAIAYTETHVTFPRFGHSGDYMPQVHGYFDPGTGTSCVPNNGFVGNFYQEGGTWETVHTGALGTPLPPWSVDYSFTETSRRIDSTTNPDFLLFKTAGIRCMYAKYFAASGPSGNAIPFYSRAATLVNHTSGSPNRKEWDVTAGDTISVPSPASASTTINFPATQTNSAAIITATGSALVFSEEQAAKTADAALRVYIGGSYLVMYASFDAFEPATKFMYSQEPGYATVTYPGVESFKALGVFGFVGHEEVT